MHELDQPETKNSTAAKAGDTAVQISGEEQNTIENKDLFHVEQPDKDKTTLLLKGLKVERQQKERHYDSDSFSLGILTNIACSLTDPDRKSREYGKRRIRELVKLGKEECA